MFRRIMVIYKLVGLPLLPQFSKNERYPGIPLFQIDDMMIVHLGGNLYYDEFKIMTWGFDKKNIIKEAADEFGRDVPFYYNIETDEVAAEGTNKGRLMKMKMMGEEK